MINRFVHSITTTYIQQEPVAGGNSGYNSNSAGGVVAPRIANLHRKFIEQPIVPNRVVPPLPVLAPAPMAEVERNMSLYLHTLHSRLSAIAGPTVTALKAWDTFMDVTKEMPMKWDQENRDRFVLRSACSSLSKELFASAFQDTKYHLTFTLFRFFVDSRSLVRTGPSSCPLVPTEILSAP